MEKLLGDKLLGIILMLLVVHLDLLDVSYRYAENFMTKSFVFSFFKRFEFDY
jgi:hypothetical protein